MDRRSFLKLASLSTVAALVPLAGCERPPRPAAALGRVAVIGGGFAGATAAKYLRKIDPRIEVTLVEPDDRHVTCPFSNAVLGGLTDIAAITHDYRALSERWGVRHVRARATELDPVAGRLETDIGERVSFDRVIVAPGISFDFGALEGYDEAAAGLMPHAWTAGTQTTLLAEQLRAMPDGGVVAIAVPRAPFRCPPGPYERASLFAWYLQRAKPRSKVLILDSNEKFSKQALFEQAWAERYGDLIERVPLSGDGAVRRVDPASGRLYTDFETIDAAVANVIPPHRAHRLARAAGLADDSGWCPVSGRDFASKRAPNTYVLGDAALASPMPKSASAANSQAKQCALSIAADFRGEAPVDPLFHNTCYSLVGPDYGISINAMYEAVGDDIRAIEGSGGLSAIAATLEVRADEADYARGWYASITADAFA